MCAPCSQRVEGFRGLRNLGLRGFRNLGSRGFRNLGLRGFRNLGLSGSRNLGLRGFRNLGSRGFRVYRVWAWFSVFKFMDFEELGRTAGAGQPDQKPPKKGSTQNPTNCTKTCAEP